MDDFIKLVEINPIWAGSIGPDASMLGASQHVKEHCAIRLNKIATVKIAIERNALLQKRVLTCWNQEHFDCSTCSMHHFSLKTALK
jgi:hypothetical protein